jgi:hypothetical protein
MIGTEFRMNGRDFSEHVHKEGVTISYSFRKGLPDKETMDGKRHVDLGKNKRLVTVRFNPTDQPTTQAILSEYRSGLIALTIYDSAVGANITITTEPKTAINSPALIRNDGVFLEQLSPLVFEEL